MTKTQHILLILITALAAYLLTYQMRTLTAAHGMEATGTVTIEIEPGGTGPGGSGSGGGSGGRDRQPPDRLGGAANSGPGAESVSILPETGPLEDSLGALPTTGGNGRAGAAMVVGGLCILGSAVLAHRNKNAYRSAPSAAERRR